MTRAKRYLVACLMLLLWAGCAPRPPFDLGLGPPSRPEEIVARLNGNAKHLHSLRAEVRLRSALIPTSRLAKAAVLFAEPDRYRVKFGSLFGGTVAVLAIQGQEVGLYMPLSNRLYEGWLRSSQLAAILGFQMSLSDLMEAMVGTVKLPPAADLLSHRTVEEGHALVFRWQGGRQEVLVAADGLRVWKVEFFDAQGQSLLVKSYQDHLVLGDMIRPGGVKLRLPITGEELELIFLTQEVNPEVEEDEFQLKLPETVERVELNLE